MACNPTTQNCKALTKESSSSQAKADECKTNVPNCQACDTSTTTKCATCSSGYTLAGPLCVKPEDNCTSLNSDKSECDICNVSFFKSTKVCAPCKENCTQCTSATDCTYCTKDFFASGNSCNQATASIGVISGVTIATVVALGALCFLVWRELRKNRILAVDAAGTRPGSLALD
ncbi:Cysteine-rich membrane protein 2 [Spironucleus salmonicida]|uniref:Cysteine-rich membrane protein 2 n=1 Tax=Spironucleus salmonicida TaxID=348837 RepID=V6LDB8_9EUKA|nr:Cysteine-rich membrane protein 2 [Spironucleus salmonicida]|eukprot:EST42477.1 Cysteine-rich membrane protein 2 [Spironucleus salmonicida]